MLFKELAQFRPNSRGIDYLAFDPAYDPDLKDEQIEYTREELEQGKLK